MSEGGWQRQGDDVTLTHMLVFVDGCVLVDHQLVVSIHSTLTQRDDRYIKLEMMIPRCIKLGSIVRPLVGRYTPDTHCPG